MSNQNVQQNLPNSSFEGDEKKKFNRGREKIKKKHKNVELGLGVVVMVKTLTINPGTLFFNRVTQKCKFIT